jgi:pilus assembly protein CpaE
MPNNKEKAAGPDPTHAIPLVAIIDTNEEDLMRTSRLLIGSDKVRVVGMAKRWDEIPHVMSSEPDIVLLDIGADGEHVPATIQDILTHAPRCQVVLTGMRDSQLNLLKSMQAGARGLVHKPISQEELVTTVTEVFQTEMMRLQRIEAQTKARVTQGRAGEVITVFSPKGGVGCTVVATHLAVALAGIEKSKVALVDFDLQFGDVAVHLDLRSTHGVHELMRNVDDLDGSILSDVMVPHIPSDVRVLLPPATLDQVEDVETEGLTAVVKALSKYYDYVVVDTWHAIEDATISLIDLSTVLLVVTTPEVPALRSTRRFLDYVRERPDRRGKVQVVVNRYPSKGAVAMAEIERSLGIKPIGSLPSDGKVITSAINEGITLIGKPGAFTSGLKGIAANLARPRLARLQRERDGARPVTLTRNDQPAAV